METKTVPVKRTRILADGTKKTYITKASYKVKNGVNDLRVNNTKAEKLSPAQKEEAWQKYQLGITIKRIAADFSVSYNVAHKCIKAKKQAANANNPEPANDPA